MSSPGRPTANGRRVNPVDDSDRRRGDARTCQSEVLPLGSVILKHPRQAFSSRRRIQADWRRLGYSAPPDFDLAVREYDAFVTMLENAGAEIHFLPENAETSIDSLYVRDASVVTDRGLVLCRMGKEARRSEPRRQADLFTRLRLPILGRIEPPGTLEGGDVAWLDRQTVAVARSYRTNDEGIRQLATLLGDRVEILRMEAPHWKGPSDVFHLMSVLSPVAPRRLLVFSPLLPIAFREALLKRGFELLEVPDQELESLGCNCLAVAPSAIIITAGNPRTRARLERAGISVEEFSGHEICFKGHGGPTCLTRPLFRVDD